MKLYYVKSAAIAVPKGEPKTVEALCPKGMVVVSGGGGGDPYTDLWMSKPIGDGSGWQVGAWNTRPDENEVNLFAWALCSPEVEFFNE